MDRVIASFLRQSVWDTAAATPLAGDASSRRYLRLAGEQGRAILMVAPAVAGENLHAFVRAARHLAGLGLSTPAIIAADPGRGLALLEDLGDDTFARLCAADPNAEGPLYEAAVDLLVLLHRAPLPDWAATYGPSEMAAFARPAWTDYGGRTDDAGWARVEGTLRDLLARHTPETGVLLHRDYHAENLVWRPDRSGVARVGLLDFQDALAGHWAYDLASLVMDARRDLSPGLARQLLRRYADATGRAETQVVRAVALQGAQRHLRILGVFARLAKERGKPGYLTLLPRVWRDLESCLAHPDLAPLRSVSDLLPAPRLSRIDA